MSGVSNPIIPKNPTNYFMEIAKGNISGHEAVVVRGHNPNQTAVSSFVDISEFGDLVYLTSAETMDIVSDDGNDTILGSGLRNLLIQGVDGSGAEIQEVISLSGVTPVTTSNSYYRVNFLIGLTAGDIGWNAGSITATASSAATIQCEMDGTESISQNSHYTVPLGKTLFIQQLELNVARDSGGQLPVVEFKAYARAGGAGNAWIQLFDKKIDVNTSAELDIILPTPAGQAVSRSDIRIRSDTDKDTTEVRTRMYGILIDDS